jgi:hypothetical protein
MRSPNLVVTLEIGMPGTHPLAAIGKSNLVRIISSVGWIYTIAAIVSGKLFNLLLDRVPDSRKVA